MRRLESEYEHILLCRSGERKKKEDAIVIKTVEKFLAALEKLKQLVGKNDGKLHLAEWPETVNCNLGKICGKYTRAAKFYAIEFDRDDQTNSKN